MTFQKIFKCPKCSNDLMLKDIPLLQQKKKSPSWYETSNKYVPRKCPNCDINVSLKLTSIGYIVVLAIICLIISTLFTVSYVWNFAISMALVCVLPYLMFLKEK